MHEMNDAARRAIDLSRNTLEALQLSAVQTTGAWDLARTLDHLAQSIEFSMIGFPQPKPVLIQNTVGKLAFTVFSLRGRMSHGLDQPIPGEALKEAYAPDVALTRVKTALDQFAAYKGPLHPHFVYGALNKSQFARAHAMHITNHMQEIVPR